MAIGGTARQVFLAIVKGDSSQAVTEFNKLGKAVDKSTGQANTGLKKFTSMGKAALSEMTDLLKTPAGAAAAIAGVGTAAVKAAGQFSDLAKTAQELGRATGLSTEEASRWVAVADDFGLSAEGLQTGLGKIAKTLDAPKWGKYGIETKNAAGNLRSVNDIFLDTLDLLNRTSSETERARIGNELFGKGFAALSPLLGKSKSDLQGYLKAVSEAQVITNSEANAGERWRLAMDDLKDSLTDVATTLGEVVVSAAPLIDVLAQIGKGVSGYLKFAHITNNASEASSELADQLKLLDGNAMETAKAFGVMSGSIIDNMDTGHQLVFLMKDLGYAIAGTNTVAMNFEEAFGSLAEESPVVARQVYESLRDIYIAGARGDEQAQNLSEAYGLNVQMLGRLRDALPEAALAVYDFNQAAQEEKDAQDEAWKATKRHSEAIQHAIELRDELFGKAKSALDRQRDLTDTQNTYNKTMADAKSTTEEQKSAAFDLVESYATLTGAAEDSEVGIQRQIDKLDELLLTVQPGSPLYNALNDYKLQLAGIPAEVNTKLGLQTPSGAAFKLGYGTPSPAAPALQKIPLAGGITFKVYINNPVMSGQQIANELAAYLRRSGAADKLGFGSGLGF